MQKNIRKLYKRWINQHKDVLFKLFVTIFFSGVIGIFLGLFVLYMTNESDVQETIGQSTESKTEAETAETAETIPSFHFFVVQAGVYEEKENAEQAAQQHTNSYLWEEGQYYLFIDVATTEDKLREKYENVDEVFLKEITIKVKEDTFMETEIQWLQQFQDMIGNMNITKPTISLSNDSKLYPLQQMMEDQQEWTTQEILDLLYTSKNILEKG